MSVKKVLFVTQTILNFTNLQRGFQTFYKNFLKIFTLLEIYNNRDSNLLEVVSLGGDGPGEIEDSVLVASAIQS